MLTKGGARTPHHRRPPPGLARKEHAVPLSLPLLQEEEEILHGQHTEQVHDGCLTDPPKLSTLETLDINALVGIASSTKVCVPGLATLSLLSAPG